MTQPSPEMLYVARRQQESDLTTDVLVEKDLKADFIEGARAGLPVAVASAPFAVLFGAVAIETASTSGKRR